jgi:hypothetical protein
VASILQVLVLLNGTLVNLIYDLSNPSDGRFMELIAKAEEAIAAEQSTGMWTSVRGEDNLIAARVISVDGTEGEIDFRKSYLGLETFSITFPWWQEAYSF